MSNNDKVKALMILSKLGPDVSARGLQVNDLLSAVTPKQHHDQEHQVLFFASLLNKVSAIEATPPAELPPRVEYSDKKPSTWDMSADSQKQYDQLLCWAKGESIAALSSSKRKRVLTEKAQAASLETKTKKKKPTPKAPLVTTTSRPPPPPPPPSSSPIAAKSSSPLPVPVPRAIPRPVTSFGTSSIDMSYSGSDTETDDGPSGRKKARQNASQTLTLSQSTSTAEPKRFKDLLHIPDEVFLADDGGASMVLNRLVRGIGKTTAHVDMWDSFHTPRVLAAKEDKEWRSRKGYNAPRSSCAAHQVLVGFECKSCGYLVVRQACLMTNTTKLLSHFTTCAAKNNHTLTESGSIKQPMTADYLNFTLVESMATNNRPFNLVNDLMIQRFLDVLPAPRPKPPTARTLSRDVIEFAAFLRQHIVDQILEDMGESVLHIAMDGWTSPNHSSFLGITGSWWSERERRMRTVTLDFIHSPASHTGVEMCEQLTNSLVAMGLHQKFATITLDNASNNDTLIAALADRDEFPRFEPSQGHVRCFAHTLNLITQGFLLPFSSDFSLKTLRTKAANLNDIDIDDLDIDLIKQSDDQYWYGGHQHETDLSTSGPSDSNTYDDAAGSDEELELDDAAGADRVREERETLVGMAVEGDGVQGNGLDVPEMEDLIEEVAANLAEVMKGKRTIQKVRMIAMNIANSSKYRNAYHQMFVSAISNGAYEEGLSRRHIPRNVATRWNSTCDMLEVALEFRSVIPYFYKQPALKTTDGLKAFPAVWRLTSADFDSIALILNCLRPLRKVTIHLQSGGEGKNGTSSMVTIARIIPIIDRLTRTFETTVNDEAGLPLNIRVGARLALGVLNKYYRLTGDCNLYTFAILLHPSLRIQYMRDQRWDSEWQEQAIEALKQVFDTHYKRRAKQSATLPSTHDDFWDFPIRAPASVTRRHPIDEFIYGPVSMQVEGEHQHQVDPLTWWTVEITSSHALAVNGMRQLAIDVLTANATSCAPERAFSKAGLTVSKHRQSLKPNTIAALQCVGAWVKQGWAGYEVWRKFKKASRFTQPPE